MPDEYTNLLPPERERALARDYRLRLGVVALWLITALAVVASVLLIPSYLLLTTSEREKRNHLASLDASLKAVDEAALSVRLKTLAAYTGTLAALGARKPVSGLLRAALEVPHPGVTLSGITYAHMEAGREGTISIAGTAATRAAMRSYQLAMQEAPFAASAQIPVSAFARDADIPFTLTIALKP